MGEAMMKMRNVLLQTVSLTIAVVVGAALPLNAQNAPVGRVVVVDGERVTAETQIGREVRTEVESAANNWQLQAEQIQAELQNLLTRRQQQALTLRAQALTDLNTQIEVKEVALERLQDDARRQLERLQIDGQQRINQVLVPVLERLAAERGWDLVFDSRLVQTGSLLHYSRTLDMTDEFIAGVNTATESPD
jgi:Skp family chaperone for outer membrane proteins